MKFFNNQKGEVATAITVGFMLFSLGSVVTKQAMTDANQAALDQQVNQINTLADSSRSQADALRATDPLFARTLLTRAEELERIAGAIASENQFITARDEFNNQVEVVNSVFVGSILNQATGRLVGETVDTGLLLLERVETESIDQNVQERYARHLATTRLNNKDLFKNILLDMIRVEYTDKLNGVVNRAGGSYDAFYPDKDKRQQAEQNVRQRLRMFRSAIFEFRDFQQAHRTIFPGTALPHEEELPYQIKQCVEEYTYALDEAARILRTQDENVAIAQTAFADCCEVLDLVADYQVQNCIEPERETDLDVVSPPEDITEDDFGCVESLSEVQASCSQQYQALTACEDEGDDFDPLSGLTGGRKLCNVDDANEILKTCCELGCFEPDYILGSCL